MTCDAKKSSFWLKLNFCIPKYSVTEIEHPLAKGKESDNDETSSNYNSQLCSLYHSIRFFWLCDDWIAYSSCCDDREHHNSPSWAGRGIAPQTVNSRSI